MYEGSRFGWQSHARKCSTSRGSPGSSLAEDEVERFQEQLSAILEAVSKVSELDLADVPPTSHPLDDRERLGRGRAAALRSASTRSSRTRPTATRTTSGRHRHERACARAAGCPLPGRRPRGDGVSAVVDTLRLSAEEARSLLDRGEVSPRELWDAYRGRDRRARRRAARVPDARRGARRRRRPDRAQGRDLDEGRPHHRRLEDPRATTSRSSTRPSPRAARRPACRCSARRTPTSSRWAPRPRTPPTGRRGTRGTRRASRAARAAARPPRSPPGSRPGRSAPTPAARSSSRPRSAATSGSGRPTARSPATASSPSPRASTRSGRSTRNVRDNALLYGIISGRDARTTRPPSRCRRSRPGAPAT